MEGNFYVSSSSVSVESEGKLAKAFLGCQEQAKVYGKCVEKAHANKDLKKDSCKEQRMILKSCIDEQVMANRALAMENQNQQQTSTAETINTTASTTSSGEAK